METAVLSQPNLPTRGTFCSKTQLIFEYRRSEIASLIISANFQTTYPLESEPEVTLTRRTGQDNGAAIFI